MKVFRRGTTPAGVTTPCGAISVTRSPTKTPSARASSEPRMMLKLIRLQGVEATALHVRAEVGDPVLEIRQDAAHQRAAHRLPVGEHPCACTKGAAAKHLRLSGSLLRDPLPSRPFRR
jgi:hypothetical protein